MADTLSADYAPDDVEYDPDEDHADSSTESSADSSPGIVPSDLGERFLLGFGIGVLGCTLVAIFFDAMVLGVAIGFILGTVLGTLLAVR